MSCMGMSCEDISPEFPLLLCFGVEVSYTRGEDGVWRGVTYGASISQGFSLSEVHTWYEPSDKPYILK